MMKSKLTQEGELTNQRGQTTVEFALVVGLLLILLFGIIDFSRLMFAYATMSNGVREGARYGVIHPGQDAQIIQRARAMMVLIGGTATVEVSYPKTDAQGNRYCSHKCTVVVTARSDFDVWTPLIPHLELVAQSTMHIE